MPLWSVQEWRVRIACSYSALGVWRPIKLRGYGGRIKSKQFVSSYPDRCYLSSFVETCWQKISSAAFMLTLFVMVDLSNNISLLNLGRWAGKVVKMNHHGLAVPFLKCALLVSFYFKLFLLPSFGGTDPTVSSEKKLNVFHDDIEVNLETIARNFLTLCWQNLFSLVVMVVMVVLIGLKNILAFPCWGEWQTRVVVPQLTHLLAEVSLKCVMVTLPYLKLLLLLSGDIETNPGPDQGSSTRSFVNSIHNSFWDSDNLVSMAFLLIVMATLLLESGNVERNPGPVHVVEDAAAIIFYLKNMENEQIKRLGAELGLNIFAVQDMQHLPDDMVRAWLRREGRVIDKCGKVLSWETLAQALQTIGQTGIAHDILIEKCGQSGSPLDSKADLEAQCSSDGSSPQSGRRQLEPQFPNLDTSFASLSEFEKNQLLERLRSKFRIVVNKVFILLSKQGCPDADIATRIVSLWSNPHEMQAKGQILTSKLNEIQLLLLDNKYITFFDYEMLEAIIETYELRDARRSMNEYISELKKFSRRSVFEVPSDVMENNSPKSNQMLVVKVSDKYFGEHDDGKTFTMQDLRNVKTTMTRILPDCRFMYVKCIEKGCVQVTFVLLSPKKVLPLSGVQLERLGEIGINVIHQHYPRTWLEDLQVSTITTTENNQQSSRTAEYNAFRTQFDKLVIAVKCDVENVARKAFGKSLITPESLDNATNRHHDETHRATKLLKQVLTRIEQNPACFDTFIAILKSVPSLDKLAQELTSQFEDAVMQADSTSTVCQPGKPIASAKTRDSITLQWKKPDCENVESYLVSYCRVDDQTKLWKKVMTDSKENKLTITKLTPQTKYLFKVRPDLEDGGAGIESETSDPVETKAPLCQPGKPTASAVTHNCIALQWDKPEHRYENIHWYRVRYRCVDPTSKWKRDMTENCETNFTVSELTPQTKYVFKVRPELEDGQVGDESEASDPIETKTTSPPSKPRAIAVTHNSITLSWKVPDISSTDIQCYTIYFSTDGDKWTAVPKSIKQQKSGSSISCTVQTLDPNTSYSFRVIPVCVNGTGSYSGISYPIMTKPSTSPPGKPIATKVTHDSVSLKWNPPEYCCEKIDYYNVYYRASADQPDKWESKKSSSTQLTINALNYNTEYIFKVRPICKNGEGSESQLSNPIKTNPASPPGKPTATTQDRNSITLSWSKPKYGSKNGIHYLILLIKKDIVDSNKWTVLKLSSLSTSIEIMKLDPTTEYLFKVKLVCHGGESDESEVSDPIETKPICKPGRPYATKVTRNSIVLTWKVPEHCGSSVTQYTILPVSRDKISDQIETIQAQSNPFKTELHTVCNLAPGQCYMFKVVPSGSNSDHCIYTESEPSDQIVTTVTSAPGTPEISDVTNDTAVVKWTHPDHGKANVVHYTVCYRSATDPSSDWKHQNTSGQQTSQVITGLSMKTKYIFKVIPKCKDGMQGTESETSDPIETAATSPPGVPEVTKVTHEQISLKWTPPDVGGEKVSSYCVYYKQLEDKYWKDHTTAVSSTYIIINRLDTNKYYQFKVKAICKPGYGNGAECKASEAILANKSCSTGKPRAKAVTHNSIELVWDKPQYGYEYITCYEVSYRYRIRSGNMILRWHETKTEGRHESIVITGLSPNTEHIFKVRPVCEGTDIHTPFCITSFIKTEDKPLAVRVFDKCSKSDCIVSASRGNLQVYRVPNLRQNMKNDTKRIATYHYGTHVTGTRERVIMLVGATGAGKSTLINSIANYVLGVSWETPFRFKLIEDEQVSQAHSQTSWITAYTFHAQKGSPINYNLTIVDTPGFGDTRGITRDKEITRHIKEFFSVRPPNGIDLIHAIGFVVQAPLARLTQAQKYVFDSILAMFGKDMYITDSIFLMATFADDQPPQVLTAIDEANIPRRECFKFNNSVLYANTSTGGKSNQLFWEMNTGNIKSFFKILETTPANSLQLTKEVLQKHKQLEATITALQEKFQMGLNHTQEMQREEFTYEVDVVKTREVPLKEGTYVTNCTQCNFTCHYPCTIKEDAKKYECDAMGGWWMFRNKDCTCQVCPGKCHWTEHEQTYYRIEKYTEKETRNLKDLMERYLESSESEGDSNESVADKMLSSAREKLQNKEVLDLIKQTQKCVKRLQEIAYKPHPLNEEAYIDLMIESEKREGKAGFAGRVSALEALKEQAKLLSTLSGYDAEGIDTGEPKPAETNWWSLGSLGSRWQGSNYAT